MSDILIVDVPSSRHSAEFRYRDPEGRAISVRVSGPKTLDVAAPLSRLPKDWIRIPEEPTSYPFAFFAGGLLLALGLVLPAVIGLLLIMLLHTADWLPDLRSAAEFGSAVGSMKPYGNALSAAIDLFGFFYARFALIAWPVGMIAILVSCRLERRASSTGR